MPITSTWGPQNPDGIRQETGLNAKIGSGDAIDFTRRSLSSRGVIPGPKLGIRRCPRSELTGTHHVHPCQNEGIENCEMMSTLWYELRTDPVRLGLAVAVFTAAMTYYCANPAGGRRPDQRNSFLAPELTAWREALATSWMSVKDPFNRLNSECTLSAN